MTPREQFEAALSALTESQRREVRLLARPFEWTCLEEWKHCVWGRCREVGKYDIGASHTEISVFCAKCREQHCVHVLALQTLYYGGHSMVTIVDRQGDDR